MGIVVYTDSSIKGGNPGGHLTWAFWASSPTGEALTEQWGSVGHGEGMTNNLGEITAALRALRWAYSQGYRTVTLRSDSRLLVNQARGVWPCKSEGLQPVMECIRLAHEHISITWEWISREANARADKLSRKPYQGQTDQTKGRAP